MIFTVRSLDSGTVVEKHIQIGDPVDIDFSGDHVRVGNLEWTVRGKIYKKVLAGDIKDQSGVILARFVIVSGRIGGINGLIFTDVHGDPQDPGTWEADNEAGGVGGK